MDLVSMVEKPERSNKNCRRSSDLQKKLTDAAKSVLQQLPPIIRSVELKILSWSKKWSSTFFFSSADRVIDGSYCSTDFVASAASVNFFCKSLLLLQFLLDRSDFSTMETRSIGGRPLVAGMSIFHFLCPQEMEIVKTDNRYSSYSSCWIILIFLPCKSPLLANILQWPEF